MKPIIDVHAHIFNALDIPLKGFLLSRKAENCFEKILNPALIPVVARCLRKKVKGEGGFFCKLTLGSVYAALGKQYRGWANTLSRRVKDVTKELIYTYRNDGVNLFVPLMIDYEYWFVNSVDTPIKMQIDRFAKMIPDYKGAVHPFAPFDPAREIAFRKGMEDPDGRDEIYGSLDLVKDAVENKGFIGVKLYNAIGYKPFNNAGVDEKRRKIPLHRKKKQYHFNGEEYDEVLSELYQYCIENEVPITAHCIMDGTESYKNAGMDFGKAEFWRDVLDQESFKNLRLNLAHFGWNQDKGQGYHGDRSWVKKICQMMEKYNNLYADVAHHRVVLDAYRQRFINDYKEIFNDHPIVKERLLYGVDWHVIKRIEGYSSFKDNYMKVLKSCGSISDADIDNFLGGNALEFMGMTPEGKNLARLKTYYENNTIAPPEWFIAAGMPDIP